MLFASWKGKAISLREKSPNTKSVFIRTSRTVDAPQGNIVGADAKGNCNLLSVCASVSNKNAPITSRGIFVMSSGHTMELGTSTITLDTNGINRFVGCYV